MNATAVHQLIFATFAGVCVWSLLCGPKLYAKFRRRMLVRRLRAIQKENSELWDYDETEELPDLFALMQREKELEAEAEQLLLAHGLDPNKFIDRTRTKSFR